MGFRKHYGMLIPFQNVQLPLFLVSPISADTIR